jgi:hypothetical protein
LRDADFILYNQQWFIDSGQGDGVILRKLPDLSLLIEGSRFTE